MLGFLGMTESSGWACTSGSATQTAAALLRRILAGVIASLGGRRTRRSLLRNQELRGHRL
jgi:hypothetical protein